MSREYKSIPEFPKMDCGFGAEEGTLAAKVYRADAYCKAMNVYLYEEVCSILGFDFEKSDDYDKLPLENTSFNYYNNVINLYPCDKEFTLSPSQNEEILKLGFSSIKIIITPLQQWEVRLDKLIKETSSYNWDNEGGSIILPELWNLINGIVNWSLDKSFLIPFVAPCGDGSVHIHWNDNLNRKFVAEVYSSTNIIYSIHVANMETIYEDKPVSLEEVKLKIERFYHE